MWSTALSVNTSAVHLQTQKILQNTSWEWAGVFDHQEGIYSSTQITVGWRKELGERRVIRTGHVPGGWGTWSRDQIPTSGQLFRTEEKHLRLLESAAAHVWQSEWNENHTIFLTALHTLDRIWVPWNVRWLGAGLWGLESNPSVRSAFDCRERVGGGHEGVDGGGKYLGRKAGQPWR